MEEANFYVQNWAQQMDDKRVVYALAYVSNTVKKVVQAYKIYH